MTKVRQVPPTTKRPHFATLLLMALAPEEVGQRIRQRRLELGWTHRELADKMHTGERTVQRWQKGILPRLGTLMDLADEMGVDRGYFVEDATPESPEKGLSRMVERVEELTQRIAGLETQLQQVVDLREQIAALQPVLDALLRAQPEGRARAR